MVSVQYILEKIPWVFGIACGVQKLLIMLDFGPMQISPGKQTRVVFIIACTLFDLLFNKLTTFCILKSTKKYTEHGTARMGQEATAQKGKEAKEKGHEKKGTQEGVERREVSRRGRCKRR